MTDTERLNLIEHYKWGLTLLREGDYKNSWQIKADWGYVMGPTVRETIGYAMNAQAKWGLS